MKVRGLFVSLLVVLTYALIVLSGCSSSSDPIPQPASTQKTITAFSLNGVVGTINETAKTIAIAMPYGTSVTNLVATFTTTGASVKVGSTVQVSGTTANNFTSQVTYTVTAADNSTQDYTVSVIVALSSSKAITSFALNGVIGTINETAKTIAVTMPYGTSVTNLVATFTTTGASVKIGSTVQVSGTTANDFTSPVTYKVTAADSSTQNYKITVTVALSSAKAITTFSLNGSVGTINETNKTIAVTMPYGTYIMDLVASFATTGVIVTVGSTNQISGTTAHNFTSPVTYTVMAVDSSTQDYIVTVTVAASPAKVITAFSLDGVAGTINETEKTIVVAMPLVTNFTSLVATFITTGVSVKVGSAVQISGVTANNFTAPVTYTVTAADETTVTYTITITPGVWHHPTSLSDNISPDGQNAYFYTQVAMDDSGNAIIVWNQSDGTSYQVFKSEYRGGVWTHPANLSDNISPDGKEAFYPHVAMDNNGNAIIVWSQTDGAYKDQIFKSEYRNGGWTHPASLSDNISPDGQNADSAQVAMDNNGNIIIVWEQSDGTNWQIFKSEYRNGVWTHPASLTDKISPDGDARNPQVAMDDNGNAIIIWSEYYGANYQMFKSEYRNGIWTHPASLADNFSPDSVPDSPWPLSCHVAMDNNGNAIIVWDQPDDAKSMIFKSEYRNGVWTHPAVLSDKINPTGISALDPQVAMDENGNAIIIWYQYDGVRSYQIFKSEYRNGVWTHPSNRSDYISPYGQEAWFTHVAMNNNGNAIIVWQQSDGTNSQIFKSEYRNGAWHYPVSLSDNISPDGQDAGRPQVAMDNNGNAIIVWYQSDGVNDQIFKSEYR